jgi:hypothetical protein
MTGVSAVTPIRDQHEILAARELPSSIGLVDSLVLHILLVQSHKLTYDWNFSQTSFCLAASQRQNTLDGLM